MREDGDCICKPCWRFCHRAVKFWAVRSREVFVRTPAPRGEQRYQRRKRAERETDVWMRLVERLGSPGTASTWVHVGDRTADMFAFFTACVATHTQFLVRAAQNRRLPEAEMGYLLDQVRSWPANACRPFDVPASHGRAARSSRHKTRLCPGKYFVAPL